MEPTLLTLSCEKRNLVRRNSLKRTLLTLAALEMRFPRPGPPHMRRIRKPMPALPMTRGMRKRSLAPPPPGPRLIRRMTALVTSRSPRIRRLNLPCGRPKEALLFRHALPQPLWLETPLLKSLHYARQAVWTSQLCTRRTSFSRSPGYTHSPDTTSSWPPTAWILGTAPRPTSRTASRSGPKSRGCSGFSVGPLLFLLLCLLGPTVCIAATDARVSGLPTESLGAEVSTSAKPCGVSSHTWRAADLPASRKRSFRRALRRASVHGSTLYRGRRFSSEGLEQLRIQTSATTTARTRTPSSSAGRRLRILSVNLDGMTAAVYDSFTLWLQTAPYDIVFLQEIHRGFGAESSEWQAGSWIYISSPDNKSRFAGVAVAVRTSLAHKYTVRSLPVIPGRILHVRLSGHNYSIDVFSCYQHVINSRETQAANASKRDLFWSTLGKYLASLPFRNVLILAGDFNCAARREDGIAGPAAPPSNPYYFDQDDFMGLMAAGSLCLLNTWSCSRHNDMNTFINGAMRSQIDYVATRVTSADAQARLSRPVLNLDFAPWRLGCKHRPVQATIRLKPGWLVASTRRPPTIGYDKTGLESALRAQGPSAALFHQEVQSAVQRLEHPTAASLNQMLLHVCERSFPLRPKTVRLRPWQQADVQASVREMWRLRADLRRVGRDVRLGLYSLRQAFRAFQAHWRFQKCYKEVRKRGLWHRRQALHDHLAQARAAEMNRDVRTIYQVVRSIAPKMLGGRVRIRSVEGALLTPAQEHAEISDYFRTLFSQIEHSVQPAPRLIPVTLEVSEIQASLGRLGSSRAVPHGHAPTSAWRYCRQVLSGPLTEAFHSETIAGYPLHWADCHLALVPKPGKVIKRPESLRPLGIQDAAGKTISRVIKERLFLQIRELLESYPQFAYLRHRSTADAIRRVSEHCSKIRSRVAMDRHNVYSKKAGKRRQPYVGGAQLTLDMSTAFDRLPRRYMQEALEWAQVDASLASLILDTHCSCRYHIRHEGFESTVEMENGVRQGCTLAPLIWALYSVFLIHQLELRLHSTWPREALTLYADDTHCAWELNSLADLKFFIRSAVLLLSVYQTFGMKINPVKSALMIRLVGTHGSKWVQRHTLCIDNKPLFLFSHDLQTYHIPIVKQAKYLGVIISYQGYESASLKHRLQSAGLARQRLARVLHTSRYISTRQRLVIYSACVRTVLLYGLIHLQLSEKDLLALHRRDIKYIRAIAKSPVHITRESTTDLPARLHCKPIKQVYYELSGRLAPAANSGSGPSPQLGMVVPPVSRGLQELLPDTQAHPCPTCGVYFPSRHILKIHHTRKHGVKLGSSVTRGDAAYKQLDISQHSLHGMPTCRHCNLALVGWQEFRTHILNACPILHGGSVADASDAHGAVTSDSIVGPAEQSAAGPQMSLLSHRSDVLSQLQLQNWYMAVELPGVRDHLRHHCSFCGKWISDRSGSLENHLRQAHAEIYTFQKAVRSQCRTVHLVRSSPCGVCSAPFARSTKHQCTMLQHLCYLREASIRPKRVQGLLHFRHDVLSTSGCSEYVSAHGCRDGTLQADSGGGGRTDSGLGQQTLEVPAPGYEGLGRLGEGRDGATPVRSPSNRDGGPLSGDGSGSGTQDGHWQPRLEGERWHQGQGSGDGPTASRKSPAGLAKFFGPPGQARMGLTELGGTGTAAIGQGLRPGVGGECQAASPALPASRGRAQPDACGTGLRHHDGDPGGGGAFQALSAVHCLEGEEGEGRGGLLAPPGSLPGAVPSVAGALAGSGSRHCGGKGPEGADHGARSGVHPGGPDRAPLVVHEVGPDNFNADEARGCGAPQAEPDREQPRGTQQVISAPTVLQRFHSTRRMSSTYEGETVTFLLSVGLRDPKAAQAWGLLNNLSGNSSGKVIGLRMHPTRMDRQPVAKVVAERFPPPAPRRRETQQRGGMEPDEVALKQVEEGS